MSNSQKGDGGVSNPPKGDGGVSNPPKGDGGVCPTPQKGTGGVSNPPKGDGGCVQPPKRETGCVSNPKRGTGVSNSQTGEEVCPTPKKGMGVCPTPKRERRCVQPQQGDGGVDWAGDRDTRRSRSGGVALLAGCTVKSWSNRQATPAMSSAEAEYYAMVKACAESLGIQALPADLGWAVRIRLCVDSSAAKAMASRSGVERVRHMEVRFLWLQDVEMRERLELKKICGKKNPADVLTKSLTHSVVRELLSACRLCFADRPGTDVRSEGRCRGFEPFPQLTVYNGVE